MMGSKALSPRFSVRAFSVSVHASADRARRRAHTGPPATFSPVSVLAKNVFGFCLWRSPFYGHFGMSPKHGRSRSFSARQESSYFSPGKRLAVVPRHPLDGIGGELPGVAP